MKANAPGLIAATVLMSGTPLAGHAESSLALTADTPSVAIGERGAGRNFLRLPELQFAFRIDAQCADNLQPFSLLVSVADTRKTFNASAISAGTASEFSLTIPSDQIAPVAINDFCTANAAEEHRHDAMVEIPGALSAQASLRCMSDSDEQTVYTSTPLNVELICEIEEQDDPD